MSWSLVRRAPHERGQAHQGTLHPGPWTLGPPHAPAAGLPPQPAKASPLSASSAARSSAPTTRWCCTLGCTAAPAGNRRAQGTACPAPAAAHSARAIRSHSPAALDQPAQPLTPQALAWQRRVLMRAERRVPQTLHQVSGCACAARFSHAQVVSAQVVLHPGGSGPVFLAQVTPYPCDVYPGGPLPR